jgi:hypothetical protein
MPFAGLVSAFAVTLLVLGSRQGLRLLDNDLSTIVSRDNLPSSVERDLRDDLLHTKRRVFVDD